MASSISGPTRLQPVYQPDRHTIHLFLHLPIRFLSCLLRCFARERALSVGGSAAASTRPPNLRSMTSPRDAHVIFVLLGASRTLYLAGEVRGGIGERTQRLLVGRCKHAVDTTGMWRIKLGRIDGRCKREHTSAGLTNPPKTFVEQNDLKYKGGRCILQYARLVLTGVSTKLQLKGSVQINEPDSNVHRERTSTLYTWRIGSVPGRSIWATVLFPCRREQRQQDIHLLRR